MGALLIKAPAYDNTGFSRCQPLFPGFFIGSPLPPVSFSFHLFFSRFLSRHFSSAPPRENRPSAGKSGPLPYLVVFPLSSNSSLLGIAFSPAGCYDRFAVKSGAVGVDYGEGPPVPIPNTEVKLVRAEDTWLATAWENRCSPTQKGRPEGRSFCFAGEAAFHFWDGFLLCRATFSLWGGPFASPGRRPFAFGMAFCFVGQPFPFGAVLLLGGGLFAFPPPAFPRSPQPPGPCPALTAAPCAVIIPLGLGGNPSRVVPQKRDPRSGYSGGPHFRQGCACYWPLLSSRSQG